jgi:hypothetical protein
MPFYQMLVQFLVKTDKELYAEKFAYRSVKQIERVRVKMEIFTVNFS